MTESQESKTQMTHQKRENLKTKMTTIAAVTETAHPLKEEEVEITKITNDGS